MRIFLIGFMGSGKSHWGKRWAASTGMTFYDLDTLIEEKEQMTIDQLFEKKGEAYFRKVESAMLSTLVDVSNGILACGGGTPCFDDNMLRINEMGTSIYLKATPLQLLNNLLPEIEKRPLFKKVNNAEILFFIEQKLAERKTYYEQARLQIPIESLTDSSINDIVNL